MPLTSTTPGRQELPEVSSTFTGASLIGRGRPWAERWLPAPGAGRNALLLLSCAALFLKALAILHYRADSDETQHAHVVWAWTMGQLQYRDVFDNHMPLFQMACAPFFRLLGQRAHILEPLRLGMLPLFFVSLWALARVGTILFSRKAGLWAALFAALCPWFFYPSTEFRTDDLWAAFWFLGLVVALSGPFTTKRAFAFGLVLGLAFAVSMKTVVLALALGTSTITALALNRCGGGSRSISPVGHGHAVRVIVILAGVAVAPGAIVLFFALKGAFWIMYYCVIQHNLVPGLKRWGHLSLHQWYFPISFPILVGYGALICRQARDPALALRRVIILLTPCFYYALLWSYWPDITREDNLPAAPLLPLAAIPLILLLGGLWKKPNRERVFWSWILPAAALMELVWTWKVADLRMDRLRVTTHFIHDILQLTKPGDYVMDDKGDSVFRPRAYYWVLEPLTKARMRMGRIADDIPECLEKTDTRICYLYCGHPGSRDADFIISNYMPFDPAALDIGAAGKQIGNADSLGTFDFDVFIPATYSIVSEFGATTGVLDGQPYHSTPVFLGAGHHEFRRATGHGRTAIFLSNALTAGYFPLFSAWDIIKARLMPPVPGQK